MNFFSVLMKTKKRSKTDRLDLRKNLPANYAQTECRFRYCGTAIPGAVCKILIDSRAFPKDKMKKLIYQIVGSSVPEPEQKHIYELVNNELFHYIEPRHKTDCSEMLWQIGEAVRTNHYIEIEYQRTKDKSIVTRRLRPAAIIFSEYYKLNQECL